jgi:hypothetical protein
MQEKRLGFRPDKRNKLRLKSKSPHRAVIYKPKRDQRPSSPFDIKSKQETIFLAPGIGMAE